MISDIFFRKPTFVNQQKIFNREKIFKCDQYNKHFRSRIVFVLLKKLWMNQFLTDFQLVGTKLFKRSNMTI